MLGRRLKPNDLVCFDCKSVCHPSPLEKAAAERPERGSLQKDQPEALSTPSPFLHMDCTVLQALWDLPRRNEGTGVPCRRLYNSICLFTAYVISTITSGLLGRGGIGQKEESCLVIDAFSWSMHSKWHGISQRRKWETGFCPEYKCNFIAAASFRAQHSTRHSGRKTVQRASRD